MQKPAVTVMVKAARLAGNVLLRNINKLEALNVVQKGRMDYASEVDADAEKVIIKELKRAYPDYGIMAEEGGVQAVNRYMWVIDPLDGTSNYLRGFPHYCVSIALVENGEPIDAVIFDPLGGGPQGSVRGDDPHRFRAARAQPHECAAEGGGRVAGAGRRRAPHRFGGAGPGLCGLRPR